MFPPLYAILDPTVIKVPILEMATALADSGVTLIQLRDKRAPSRDLYLRTRELTGRLRGRNIRVIVNDRPDVAAIAGAGGVHVGQEDIQVEDARRIVGAACWVGVSTHNREQLREAAATSADYIAVGPIFPTGTKANPDPVVGLEFIREARKLTGKPIVAIGGITLETAASVFEAGADSIAVITDLLSAANPTARAREYLMVAESVRRLRP